MNRLIVFVFYFAIFIQMYQAMFLSGFHPVEDNVIITTESKIREILTNIFDTFNISSVINLKLEHYLTIHNCLLSTTLEDFDNFRDIEMQTRPKDFNTVAEDFRNVLSELDDHFNNSFEEQLNNQIFNITGSFLNELKVIKQSQQKDIRIESFILNKLIVEESRTNEFTESSDESGEILEHEKESFEEKRLPLNVSIKMNRRVYKGKKAKIRYFPFMASILILQKFFCAGSIISSDLIITAASCLQESWSEKLFRENPTFLSVRVGSASSESGGVIVSVKEVFFYPTYDSKTLKDNLCLLRLATNVKFSDRKKRAVRKIEFDGQKKLLHKKSDVTIIGWGTKNHHNRSSKRHMRYSKLKVISLKKCKVAYKQQHIKKRRSFCAKSSSKVGDACEHDVGDPGIVNGILTGVVSFGSPDCGYSRSPTVFTQLGHYAKWIENVIEPAAGATNPSVIETTETTQMTVTNPTDEQQTDNLETTAATETLTLNNTVTTELSNKQNLRHSTGNKMFLKDLNDSAQPPPIYIADGVKSILYNNEYNIYFVTKNPERIASNEEDSDENSKESLSEESDEFNSAGPKLKTTIGIVDADPSNEEEPFFPVKEPPLTHSEATVQPEPPIVREDQIQAQENKTTETILPQHKTGLAVNSPVTPHNVNEKSKKIFDFLKKEIKAKMARDKKNVHPSQTHKNFKISTSSAEKTTEEPSTDRTADSSNDHTNMKYIFKDFQQFLKQSVSSQKPIKTIDLELEDNDSIVQVVKDKTETLTTKDKIKIKKNRHMHRTNSSSSSKEETPDFNFLVSESPKKETTHKTNYHKIRKQNEHVTKIFSPLQSHKGHETIAKRKNKKPLHPRKQMRTNFYVANKITKSMNSLEHSVATKSKPRKSKFNQLKFDDFAYNEQKIKPKAVDEYTEENTEAAVFYNEFDNDAYFNDYLQKYLHNIPVNEQTYYYEGDMQYPSETEYDFDDLHKNEDFKITNQVFATTKGFSSSLGSLRKSYQNTKAISSRNVTSDVTNCSNYNTNMRTLTSEDITANWTESSQEYIYELIGKAVDEIESEMKRNETQNLKNKNTQNICD